MAPKKKAKKSKTLGKKDLKKTKGGTLNFALQGNALKFDIQKSDLTVEKPLNPGSIEYLK